MNKKLIQEVKKFQNFLKYFEENLDRMDYFRALKRKISSRLLSSNDLSSNIDVPQRLFPREITKIIFSYLRSPEELCSISRVCREWNEISSIDGDFSFLFNMHF